MQLIHLLLLIENEPFFMCKKQKTGHSLNSLDTAPLALTDIIAQTDRQTNWPPDQGPTKQPIKCYCQRPNSILPSRLSNIVTSVTKRQRKSKYVFTRRCARCRKWHEETPHSIIKWLYKNEFDFCVSSSLLLCGFLFNRLLNLVFQLSARWLNA